MTRRYLLDTGILSLFVTNDEAVCRRAEQARRAGADLGVSTPVLGEIRGGYKLSTNRESRLARLAHRLRNLKVWAVTEDAATYYGVDFAHTRRTGQTVGAIDLLTASIARALGSCTIITMDTDFRRLPGLLIEDWSLPLS